MERLATVIGRIGHHPRRGDRLRVLCGADVLVSFAADNDRTAVGASLRGRGFVVRRDGVVTVPPFDQATLRA